MSWQKEDAGPKAPLLIGESLKTLDMDEDHDGNGSLLNDFQLPALEEEDSSLQFGVIPYQHGVDLDEMEPLEEVGDSRPGTGQVDEHLNRIQEEKLKGQIEKYQQQSSRI